MEAAVRSLLVGACLAMGCGDPSPPDSSVPDAGSPDSGPGDSGPPDAGRGAACPGPFAPASEAELGVRRRIGIPDEADCAVLLGQNSHLDIDWQRTFDGYYDAWVEDIFLEAQDLLESDEGYRYQICEMAYLAEHLRRHPDAADQLRAAVDRGALRIVGGGMTSPDTLLPTTEALVRDYLRGTLFAERELEARPRAAWLPDSFGHAPTLPDLLSLMGYSAVAFARVDGLHSPIEVLMGQPEVADGSTAALLRDLGSTDFVWVGPGGGEVLAHWMPVRLYCQGDGLDQSGLPVPGGFLGGSYRGDDADFTTNKLAVYVEELVGYARTPYLFVPVGCDFQAPKAVLTEAARRWNETEYPATGIYVAASTFEDWADLLRDRMGDLPRMQRDITPYFTGYFGSRTVLKAAAREAGDLLVQAEVAALLAEAAGGSPYPAAELGAAWDLFVRSNHHDFITGTAVDDVWRDEQMPLVASVRQAGQAILDGALGTLASSIPAEPGAAASILVVGTIGAPGLRVATARLQLPAGAARGLGAPVPMQVLSETRHPDGTLATAEVLVALDLTPLGYRRVGLQEGETTGPVEVVESDEVVTLRDLSTGLEASVDGTTGLVTSLLLDGEEWIGMPTLVLEEYDDDGGPWRIGSETAGCGFAPAGQVGGEVILEVLERGPARARVRVVIGDRAAVEVGVTAGARRLDVRAEASAPEGRTVTLRIQTVAAGATAHFADVAGEVERPEERLFEPTFWPLVRGLDLRRGDASGIAVLPELSTGVRWSEDGTVELMVARNAVTEACDLLGAEGHDPDRRSVGLVLRPHAGSLDLAAEALALLPAPAVQLEAPAAAEGGEAVLFRLDGTGFVVSAAKRADRGEGTVLRLLATGEGEVAVGAGLLAPGSLVRTDLLERDIGPVRSPVPVDAPLITLRLGPPAAPE